MWSSSSSSNGSDKKQRHKRRSTVKLVHNNEHQDFLKGFELLEKGKNDDKKEGTSGLEKLIRVRNFFNEATSHPQEDKVQQSLIDLRPVDDAQNKTADLNVTNKIDFTNNSIKEQHRDRKQS